MIFGAHIFILKNRTPEHSSRMQDGASKVSSKTPVYIRAHSYFKHNCHMMIEHDKSNLPGQHWSNVCTKCCAERNGFINYLTSCMHNIETLKLKIYHWKSVRLVHLCIVLSHKFIYKYMIGGTKHSHNWVDKVSLHSMIDNIFIYVLRLLTIRKYEQ